MVSVIVPCYNYGWVLAETLDSLIAQTYQDWECLVVDDGSTDNTREVVEAYRARDSRFRYIHQENAWMSAARNNGLRQAIGQYVQFLDADDLLAPRKLEIQVALLEARPELDIVYGNVRYFWHGKPRELSRSLDMKHRETDWMDLMSGSGLVAIESFVKNNQLVINAPLLRMDLVRRVGYFDEELRYGEDWEYWLRCAFQGANFLYQDSSEVWSLVRVHQGSISTNETRMLKFSRQIREQLAVTLTSLGAAKAFVLNEVALRGVREQQARIDMQAKLFTKGLATYWELARSSGKYLHYARAAAYWGRAGAGWASKATGEGS